MHMQKRTWKTTYVTFCIPGVLKNVLQELSGRARGCEEEGKGKEGITCKLNLEEYEQYILEMPQAA